GIIIFGIGKRVTILLPIFFYHTLPQSLRVLGLGLVVTPPGQIEGLIKFINSNGDSREMKRALAVKLALQGYAYRAIENILNVSQGYVSKWKKRFITQGIPGLK
ncbi:helix-turn-helix domain-containing protein, partial [Microcoleus sp. AR_TQ3_B6]|uniref:helix-turn-helix domain-containing protein n=1 Tax=Microcoleus sp. AR_TQ3_B6 TaxID=3055284 RepID=UPI002FD5CB02